jgi:hypothetical protein
MKKILIKSLISFIFVIFLIELICYGLSKLIVIPQGISTHVSLFANENVSYWHPKNIKLKHHESTCGKPSIVYYNNIGARGKENVYPKKIKPRIALIGDEMIEDIYGSEDLDFASLLRKKLKDYEIINFSARSMGLADQIDVYKNLVKKYDVDYIFLFVSDDDFHNNHYTDFSQFRIKYKLIDGKITKISRNKEWFKIYNSSINKFKRGKLILYVKNYSNTFKLYFHLKIKKNLESKRTSVEFIKAHTISDVEKNKRFNENKIIYSFLVDEFLQELKKDKVEYLTFLNIKPYLFKDDNKKLDEKKAFSFLKSTWKNKNSFYPLNASIEYLKKENLYEEPWLSNPCYSSSYSFLGSKFMSNYITDIFNKH